ncbi:ring canal kelch protein [Persicitalea jodogahamensis]|uniref:Ring canal kelch protein n=1 Tax=Persicitalea jodogahamensis TaxID=402147 RepID=A0A8J3D4V4_9BACT|nr:ring canal kelch protein [Persicitalea jodogahamensis]
MLSLATILVCFNSALAQSWQAAEPLSLPTQRHECALAAADGKLYLLGGRGVKAVEEYNPKQDTWTKKAVTPLEMSHFQAITYKNEIYVLGAFTGPYPHETPIPDVYIYNPARDEWRKGPEIPADRRRGAAGAFVRNDKIYMVAGIKDGHWDGHVAWLDEYDPKTGQWKQLPDAPRPRDHVSVALVGNKLYAAGGRLSTAKTKNVFNLTIPEVDVYDFNSNTWTTLDEDQNIPTQRAGNMAVAYNGKLLILGGESASQETAHREVEAYSPKADRWEKLPMLTQGRHGTGAVTMGGKVYVVAGSANRGGGPELNAMEILTK